MQHLARRSLVPMLATLMVSATLILAACGSSSNASTQSGPVNLVFWGFNQQIAEQAALFNSTHPNIHVTGLQQPTGANQYYPKVLSAIKAGNAPDVALIEYQYVPTFVANSALVDLTQYGANDVKSQFDPAAWNEEVEGNAVYGYPQDTGPMALFYNAAIFKKAGITSPPATWADFATDAAKIHALGKNYYITAFGAQNTGWFQAMFWQAGAIWFSIDSAKQAWKVNINSAAAKQVASYWDNLISKGLVDTSASDADFQPGWGNGLDHGTIASWVSAVWGQGVIKGDAKDTSGKWAVAAMPQYTAGANASAFWGGSGISVIAGTKHAKEAEEFVRWYLTDPGSLKIGVNEIGWYPANLTARQTAATTPDPYFAGTTSGGQVVDQIFTSVTVNPAWTFPPDLTTVVQDQGDDFNAAVTNHTSISDALDKLQQQVVSDLQSQNISVEQGS